MSGSRQLGLMGGRGGVAIKGSTRKGPFNVFMTSTHIIRDTELDRHTVSVSVSWFPCDAIVMQNVTTGGQWEKGTGSLCTIFALPVNL